MLRCTLVTGSGRSGTSLTMGLLARAGATLSTDLVGASIQNPTGSFEDRTIQNLQRDMLSQFGPLTVPPPQGWLNSDTVKSMTPRFRDVVSQAVATAGDTIWAFKDPHSAYTLPLWTQIFNGEKITPSLFLCVRDPSAVITSLMRQYNFDPDTAELFWLTKNLRAIIDSGANVFVVHYEKLLHRDTDLIGNLISFAQIPNPAPTKDVATFIEKKLNRSGVNNYEVQNPLVKELWAALQNCAGSDFDADKLLREALHIEAELVPWLGWLKEVYKIHGNKPQEQEETKLRASVQTLEEKFKEAKRAAVAGNEEVQALAQERARLEEKCAEHLRTIENGREEQRNIAEEMNRLRSFASALETKLREAQARDVQETGQKTGATIPEEVQERLAKQLRDVEIGREKLQNAAENISRLQSYSNNVTKDQVGKIARLQKQLKEAIDQLQEQKNAIKTVTITADRVEKLEQERDKLKDEIIRLNGSTTMRFGRLYRAFRRAPIRETFRLPKRIIRLMQAQRSKRRFDLS